MFSLVLWEFWSHSLPQLLPDLLCLPIHLNLWPLALFCLFVFSSISSNLYYSDSLGYVVFYQSMVNLPGETVLPNADSPSPELPIDNGSSAGGGSSCFCVPIHAEEITVSSYVWLLCCIWEMIFFWIHLPLLALSVFLPRFDSGLPGLGRRRSCDVPFRTSILPQLILSTLISSSFVLINIYWK